MKKLIKPLKEPKKVKVKFYAGEGCVNLGCKGTKVNSGCTNLGCSNSCNYC